MSALTVAQKEIADALRSRALWVIVAIVAAMTSLGMGAAALVPGETDVLTAVGGAAQLAGVLVPILALVAAYLSVAGERESGSIKVLLGLPPSRGAVVAGKFLGRSLVVVIGVVGGFAVAAVVAVAVYGTIPVVAMASVTLLSAALGVAFVGIAVGISAASASRSRAMTVGVGAYLALTLLWDLVPQLLLVVVGGGSGPTPAWFLYLSVLSPTGAYNGLVANALGRAVGTPGFATGILSDAAAALFPWAMAAILVLWTAVPLVLGYRSFLRADLS